MPSSNKILPAALVLSLAAAASAKVLDDTVATVNGQPILLSEYKKNLDSVLEQYRRAMPEMTADTEAVKQVRQKVLDQMIDDELMAQQAESLKITVTEREVDNGVGEIKEKFRQDEGGKELSEDQVDRALREELKREGLSMPQFRERLKKQIRVRKWIEEKVRPKIKPPADDEARAYFDKMQFLIKGDTSVVEGMSPLEAQHLSVLAQRLKEASSERVRARHILVKVPPDAATADKRRAAALEKIKDLKKKVDGGADFAELARKHSDDDGSKARGGDLGFFLPGWMVPEFEKAAFKLGVGETSGIVETPFGYHLIRVEEKRAAQKLQFEEVKEQLQQAMFAIILQKTLEKEVGGLRAKAAIDVHAPVDKVTTK